MTPAPSQSPFLGLIADHGEHAGVGDGATVHEEICAFEDLPRCFAEMHKNTQTGALPTARISRELLA